jgi:hypothetical protein
LQQRQYRNKQTKKQQQHVRFSSQPQARQPSDDTSAGMQRDSQQQAIQLTLTRAMSYCVTMEMLVPVTKWSVSAEKQC